MCVRVFAIHVLLHFGLPLLIYTFMNTHQCVSAFELPPPLFDFGSDVGSCERAQCVSRSNAQPPLHSGGALGSSQKGSGTLTYNIDLSIPSFKFLVKQSQRLLRSFIIFFQSSVGFFLCCLYCNWL